MRWGLRLAGLCFGLCATMGGSCLVSNLSNGIDPKNPGLWLILNVSCYYNDAKFDSHCQYSF